MSELVNPNVSFIDKYLIKLIDSYGWIHFCDPEQSKKMLRNAPPFSFILSSTYSEHEDGLLTYVDANGAILQKGIHIVNRSPLKLMNGVNILFSTLDELIAHMMGCSKKIVHQYGIYVTDRKKNCP